MIWTRFMHSNVLPKKERLWARKHGLEVADSYILAIINGEKEISAQGRVLSTVQNTETSFACFSL